MKKFRQIFSGHQNIFTLLELLLVSKAGRVSELLVLVEGRRLLLLLLSLLLLLGRRWLLLPVSHARVVEVVEGGVDVTHMASSVH